MLSSYLEQDIHTINTEHPDTLDSVLQVDRIGPRAFVSRSESLFRKSERMQTHPREENCMEEAAGGPVWQRRYPIFWAED